MADSSCYAFRSFSYFPTAIRSSRETSTSRPSIARFHGFRSRSPYVSSLRLSKAKDDDRDFSYGDDQFGLYPWDSAEERFTGIEWVQDDKIMLFTADGLIQIGGSLVPRRLPSRDKKAGQSKASQRFKRFKESDYMDPHQSLCLGALFDIAAYNGLDMGRRLNIFGFCRSIEMLCDVVEDAVLEHGGEIVSSEKASNGGLQEKLTMTVAVPLLWGVPPASDKLRLAVKSGGGIVEKVFWQWDMFQ